ncbi:MAG: hypothetical protein HXY47_03425 [Nitrospirae bacterium]|nr:hypothetical protein [Nitrospirota bacterium]
MRQIIILFIFCSLIFSCGKKGDPTLKSYEKPPAPSNLKAIHRESEILLFWDFPEGEEDTIKGFQLLRAGVDISKEASDNFERLAFLEPDKRTYTDTDFKIGSQYRYKIVSKNFKGIVSKDSNIIDVLLEEPPLSPERLFFAIDFNFITLNWKSVEEKVFYNIYKSDKSGIYSLTPLNNEPLKETSFRDSFDVRKTVYYTVRSLKRTDIRSEGAPSEELVVSPSDFVPSAPEGLQAVVSEDKVYLIWKEVQETWIDGYRVYRQTDTSTGYIFIGETTVPAFIDNEKPLIKRNYRVAALGPSKEGTPAEIRDIMFIPFK